jgi:hypothetical protein
VKSCNLTRLFARVVCWFCKAGPGEDAQSGDEARYSNEYSMLIQPGADSLAPAGADSDVPLRGDTPGLLRLMSAKLGQVRTWNAGMRSNTAMHTAC